MMCRWIVAIALLCAVPCQAAGTPPAEAIACHEVDSYGEPLAVDWPAAELSALKSQMDKGVAVLSLHCSGVRVLRDCSIVGNYGYVGTAPMAAQVVLESGQEAADNLLAGGRAQAAALKPGGSLVISLATVGSRTATRLAATAADLRGTCAEATHFVRGISVGSFTLNIRGAGAQRPVPSVPAACAQATVQSTAPPPACAAPLRVRVKRIGDPALTWQDVATAPGCPKGLVLSEGKCMAGTATGPHQCEFGDRDDCQAQCARHHPGSCTALGLMLSRGATPNFADARRHFQEACDGGDTNGCRGLGFLLAQGLLGPEKDEGAAALLFQRACDQGNPASCNYLGYLFLSGEGAIRKDETRARVLLQRACDGGRGEACANLATMYAAALGVPRDAPRALGLLQKACDGAFAQGCQRYGELQERMQRDPKDKTELAALRAQCDGGNADSCERAAEGSYSGVYLTPDPSTALTYYLRACRDQRSSHPKSCRSAGNLLASGQGVAKDEAQAIELHQRACDQRDGDSCTQLGQRYLEGVGVTKQPPRARALFQRSCDAGFAAGCASLSSMLVAGAGGDKDESRGVALAQRACDAKEPLGCVLLGLYYNNGTGVARDRQRGIELISTACHGGYELGCQALTRLGP